LGVFPLAIDGFPAVVEDKPSGISADPALGIPLPGIELGVPGITSQWQRRLGCGGVGLGELVKSRLDEIIDGDVEGGGFGGKPLEGIFRDGQVVGHWILHRRRLPSCYHGQARVVHLDIPTWTT
jgi:hypothetical protein